MARNNTQSPPADEDNPSISRHGQHPDASELLPRLELAGQWPRPETGFNDVPQNEEISVSSAPSSRSRSVRVDQTDRAAQASQSQRRAAENIEGNSMENFSRQAQRHRSPFRHWQPNKPPQPQVSDTADRLAGATQHLPLYTASQNDAMVDVTRVAMSTLPGSISSNTRPSLHNFPAGQHDRLNPSGFHNIPAGRQFGNNPSYGFPSTSTTSDFNNTSDNLYVGGSRSAPPLGMQAGSTSGFDSRHPMPSSQYYSAQHDLAAQGIWRSDTDETIFQTQYWHRLDQASQETLLDFPAQPISQPVMMLPADQLPGFSSTGYYNQAGQQYTGMNSTAGSSSDINTERFDVAERSFEYLGPQLSYHPWTDSQLIYNRGNQPPAVTVPISIQPRVASSSNSPSSIQPRSTHFAQRRVRSRSSDNPASRNPFLDPITGQLPRHLQVLPPGFGARIEPPSILFAQSHARPRLSDSPFRSVLHRTADGEVIIRDPLINGREYVLRYHPFTGRPHYLEDLIVGKRYRIQPTSDTYFGYLEGAYNVIMENSNPDVIRFGASLLANTPPSSSPGPSRRLDPHH